jgi:hypothetical protein
MLLHISFIFNLQYGQLTCLSLRCFFHISGHSTPHPPTFQELRVWATEKWEYITSNITSIRFNWNQLHTCQRHNWLRFPDQMWAIKLWLTNVSQGFLLHIYTPFEHQFETERGNSWLHNYLNTWYILPILLKIYVHTKSTNGGLLEVTECCYQSSWRHTKSAQANKSK